jgi:ABC-type multidrug transport system ATPase subunit
MEFLKTYVRAAAGRRVILTIHQPSSFIWQLLDNVVLLSKGKVMYGGSRQNIEAFFAANEHPTPVGWNPADHYVIMVNDEFRDHAKSVEEWAKCYTEWELSHHLGEQKSAAFVLSDADKRNQKGRTSSMVAVEYKDGIKTQRSNSFYAVYELTYRYFLNLWFNPGILFTRVAMYTMLGKC